MTTNTEDNENSQNIDHDNFEQHYPSTQIPFFSLNNIFLPSGCLGRLNYFKIIFLSALLLIFSCSLFICLVNIVIPQRISDFSDLIITLCLIPYAYINVVNIIRRLNDIGISPLQQNLSIIYTIILTIICFIPLYWIGSLTSQLFFGTFLLILLFVPGATHYQTLHNKSKLEKNKYYMAYYAKAKDQDSNEPQPKSNINKLPIEAYAIIATIIFIILIGEFSL